jgi:DNA-binding MltR family transcriptional regulator
LATQAEYDAAAKALRTHFINQARSVIDQIPFDTLDLESFTEKLLSESDTARVLIFASYLDDRLQNLLIRQMRNLDSQNSIDRLFGVNGPLDTFSRRVLISYHLGWISEDTKQRLDAFRKVRNAFAHRAFKVSIGDPQIASLLATFDHSSQGIFQELQSDSTFTPNLLCNLVLLAFRVFEEMLVWPVARAFLIVTPKDISGSEDPPQVLKPLRDQAVRALLIAGGLGRVESEKWSAGNAFSSPQSFQRLQKV